VAQTNERPPSANGSLSETSFLAGDASENAPKLVTAQAENRPSAAVAAAIDRAKQRLLGIKRSSIASLANMASTRLDFTLEAIENVDDVEMIENGKRFLESARAFAKLLGDFRDEMEASR